MNSKRSSLPFTSCFQKIEHIFGFFEILKSEKILRLRQFRQLCLVVWASCCCSCFFSLDCSSSSCFSIKSCRLVWVDLSAGVCSGGLRFSKNRFILFSWLSSESSDRETIRSCSSIDGLSVPGLPVSKSTQLFGGLASEE